LNLYPAAIEEVRMISNNELNRELVKLANTLALSNTKANKEITKNIKAARPQ
jgi:hypothetical protein